jgi:hypothetical protein
MASKRHKPARKAQRSPKRKAPTPKPAPKGGPKRPVSRAQARLDAAAGHAPYLCTVHNQRAGVGVQEKIADALQVSVGTVNNDLRVFSTTEKSERKEKRGRPRKETRGCTAGSAHGHAEGQRPPCGWPLAPAFGRRGGKVVGNCKCSHSGGDSH